MLTAVHSINPGMRAFIVWLVLYSMSLAGLDLNLTPLLRFLIAIGLTVIVSITLHYYSTIEANESDKPTPSIDQEQTIKQVEKPIVQSNPRKKKRTKKRKKSKENVLSTLEQAGKEEIELHLPTTHHIDQLIKAESGVEFNFSRSGTRVIQ
ncbi:MAG: hypothetical protein ACW99Q_22565 [Candidatus Kariarchaeaceae archaeon]|jgi:cytoskeletal protein RodZ